MKFFMRSMTKDKPYKDIVLNGEDLLSHAEEIARLNASQGSRFPKRTLLPRVKQNMKFIEQAYREITDYSTRTQDVVPATEWLLDNFYSLKDLREEIQSSLPDKFERQLPRIASGDFQGYPRIYGLLIELIEHTDSQLRIDTLKAFINAYQVQVPLSSGELWAIPIMLRIILLENIRRLTELILFTQAEREAADRWVLPLLESEHLPAEWEGLLQSLEPQEEYSSAYAEQILKRMRDLGVDVAPLLQWVDRVVAKQDTTIEELAKLERQRQTTYQVSMGHAILSIHFITAEDWPRFFEEVSMVERVFQKDPSRVYCAMDFQSRDAYRHQVEKIARRFKVSELVVARKVLSRAQKAHELGETAASHVGYDLMGAGRETLEQELKQDFGKPRHLGSEIRRTIQGKPVQYYFGSLLIGIAILSAWVLTYIHQSNPISALAPVLWLGVLIWASSLVIPFLNWVTSNFIQPTFLPKLELRDGIPDPLRTMVVVPTLLTSVERVYELISQMEVYYLANRDANLHFALLGDFADAQSENVPGDAEIINAATAGIQNLNQKYDQGRFYFFHRKRLFNNSEDVWMGWERKRGKLTEFNCLLRQEGETSYDIQIGDLSILPTFQYVITLDADTQLPRGTAKRLIGTMAHLLHAPILSEDGTRVDKGYAILQPRVGVSILCAGASKFTRIFSGKVGIDPYTTAVSDIYQDLFSEGIYTGKGIYDVKVFHQVTHKAFPENTILSHDLIEGLYARTGLVTDIELVDGYPANYFSYIRRLHRWVRGDWQLLPWLFKPIPFVSRWKIFDNLRRSIEAPVQLLLLILGFTVLAGEPLVWVGLISLSLIWPMVFSILSRLLVKRSERGNVGHDLVNMVTQFLLQLVFFPYQAFMMLDAITRSLYRQFISRKYLLEWETAADTEKRLGVNYKTVLSTMWQVMLLVLLAALTIALNYPAKFGRFIPVAIVWIVSPWIALQVSLPLRHRREILTTSEQLELRRWGRKIWAFFEEYVSSEDHWLPPDNVQIDPPNGVAHRTSPTNIGLALLANLSALDFGYIPLAKVHENIEHTLETLESLEHWRGHLYNWYDTQTLVPLEPRYISTVDSGNFVLYLLTLKSGLAETLEKPLIDLNFARGLKDTYNLLLEVVDKATYPELEGFEKALDQLLDSNQGWSLANWLKLLSLWPELLLEPDSPKEGVYWARRIGSMVRSFRQETEAIYPWIKDTGDLGTFPDLNEQRFTNLSLTELAKYYNGMLEEDGFSPERTRIIQPALQKIQGYIQGSEQLQHRLEEIFVETDFKPLFDEARQLFSIGYRVSESMLDKSYYDLLASEARQASFLAIAKGDVPHSHWFKLGRSLTVALGERSLVSWSGTMFEFLMPLLVMRNYEGTLLDETYHSVVAVQRKYGLEHNVPWGISESGFHAFDPQLNYQYKAFGVPGLGLKRGLIQDLVIAPYATFLALMVSPHEALSNIIAMEQKGFGGRYGLYEAIDYTTERVPVGRSFKLVQSFMAHHQGMSLLALDNALHENVMQQRLHNQALIQATELLLQERIPESSLIIPQPENEQTRTEHKITGPEHEKNQFILIDSVNSPIPITHCISNGQYSVMLTNSGAGFSRFKNICLSRWREDVTRDPWGMFFYIQNLNSGDVWSAAYQPCRNPGDDYKVTYAADQVEYCRKDGNITTHTEIVVSPEDQAEMRRISLTNHSKYDRTLEVTSYFEVVLARSSEDLAHPAFSNLFIQTEFTHESLLASRRPRSDKQTRLWMMHTVATEGEKVGSLQYETDRMRFIGRGRNLENPQALDANHPLSNTVGAVLDPMMSLRQRVKIGPGQTVRVSFSVGYAESRQEIIRIAEKYRDPLSVNRAFELAWTHSKMELRHLNLTAAQANESLSLGGHLLYLSPCRRDEADFIKQNSKGQSSLWPYAISGDLPIVLVRVKEFEHLDLVRRLLTIHEYWRLKGLFADLVILNEDQSGYVQAFQDSLRDLISMGHARDLLNQAGGVFLLQKDHVHSEGIVLLSTVARIVFNGEGGSCTVQIRKKGKLIKDVVDSQPSLQDRALLATQESIQEHREAAIGQFSEDLLFANGYGGFSEDGKEYIIRLQEGMNTPLPWINVIANPKFGFQISEVGAGYTWSQNSREYKLTPWSNDPIMDYSGEVLYLRDEKTGESWSVTANPKRGKGSYTIRHGQGYSIFEHLSHGLKQALRLFAPIDESVKIVELTVTNMMDYPQRLSAIYYVEWVLGVAREHTAPYLVTDYDRERNCFFAENRYQEEYADRIGFLTVFGAPVTSFTGDRSEFIGRNRSLADPLGLELELLSETVGAGLDPCSALHLILSLAPGESKTITFLLGEAENRQAAEGIITLYGRSEKAGQAFEEVTNYWNKLLGTVQVSTPDMSMNLLLNRWLLYQTVVCRLWARSAFYQSGGAYGFRDQLQDVMALVYTIPQATREQIILHCGHQFIEGDVQHWWHASQGKGIRTKFTDDLLWLPFVTAHYIERTGDEEILKEVNGFLEDEPLKDDEDERYSIPHFSQEQGSVYEHCIRAIERGLRFGEHGLPLIGSGDWNDGFSQIGTKGKGESVWLGWFLYLTLIRFAVVCDRHQDLERGIRYRRIAEELQKNMELHGWDGGWYRRAYFDDGSILGSSRNQECQIDAIAQSWSVLSGAAKPTRAQDAMLALEHYLWRKEDGILLLLTPPFDKCLPDPGYIKGYVPGVRENGGQYTHGAAWAIMAYTSLGEGDKAGELFQMLSPINHARTEHEVNRYKVEPYVMAADVYAIYPHVGRGGWTWYTGAAGWMYQAGLEGILGFTRQGEKLILKPCIPSRWTGYSLTYQYQSTKYEISVENPYAKMTGCETITLDGDALDEPVIVLKDDGLVHTVRLIL
ncbi:GH36-type glycosyl hydrolase domain-containing protein [Desulfosporosinus sp. BICA1-9]|uniref:GH36-type glycosyl hydrolase domain-containing protein n=1 Tax=Desulfosporosinus sp. BICA1-9 TaxID=1531958 RepID=UPI00054B9249|nr:glucoamylase family protein [Desulfosporosinus sp. BICA1-9]KJS50398.1 MAG: glycosyl transferase family 36 [Peptococcaceae bacterium BRH_c23]KJS88908.1 MAG: glycosyl transferase family 36 [Desulfosporosinus sp. BICA1-9]